MNLDDLIVDLPTSRGFATLLSDCRRTGGTARSKVLARLPEDHGLGNFVGLAGRIEAKEVFSFKWIGTRWLPTFQFDLRDLSIKPSAVQALSELGCIFDGWARVAWFAKPKCGLAHRRAADVLGCGPFQGAGWRARRPFHRRRLTASEADMERAEHSISRLCAAEHCRT